MREAEVERDERREAERGGEQERERGERAKYEPRRKENHARAAYANVNVSEKRAKNAQRSEA